MLSVKDNQKHLAESIRNYYAIFQENRDNVTHTFHETIEKNHGRIEVRRCYAFSDLQCLSKPEQWSKLQSFAVIESERHIGDKVSKETRLYMSSLMPDAKIIAHCVRSHWAVENKLHWCMDMAFNDDQMRARTKNAAKNLATVKQLVINLIRSDTVKRKGGIKARRLIAAADVEYCQHLLHW